MVERQRWSDDKLEQFYIRFSEHVDSEDEAREQHRQMFEAIFQKEDADRNVPPGLLQLCARMSADLTQMRIANDRQKRFIGGIAFAFSSMLFFFTDTAHKLFSFLKGI